jgi:transketolase
MAAMCSGMARHGALRATGTTFMVFSDYARPSLRLAAMMRAPVTYKFTHDSIGVGEDGPTHQPIEQMAAFRSTPNWTLIRPADANEAVQAWRAAMENDDGPTCIICSRQKLPVFDRNECASAEGVQQGAYVLLDAPGGDPDVILMATGSEVWKAVEAREKLAEDGVQARVVSFASWELFEKQPESYRNEVLPPDVKKRLAIETGVPTGWHRWVGDEGDTICIETFGASAPGETVMEKYGFSVENIVKKAKGLLD